MLCTLEEHLRSRTDHGSFPGRAAVHRVPHRASGICLSRRQGINKYGGPTVKYGLFAPRFGFAWSPGGNKDWSIHGGIGLYYNRSEEELTLQTLTNAPFAITRPAP